MESLKAVDEGLFRLLNFKLTYPLLDIFMLWITEPRNFYILFILIGSIFVFWGGNKGRKALVLILLTILISDQSASFLKDQLQRVRPCNMEESVRLLVGCTKSFSMPSAHAANSFGVAVILSFLYKKLSPFVLFIAFLIAYSRIYVGVHYPSDVLAGAILGMFLAFLILLAEWEICRVRGVSRKIRR